ncbi:MAG: hypothetical protein K8R08_08140 [Methanosarcinales archaeon]|nr:hypothetical protein [Methanosarcinales archaeon]
MTKKSLYNRLTRLEKRNLRKCAEIERVQIYDPVEGLENSLAGLPDTDETIIFIPDNGRNLTGEHHT